MENFKSLSLETVQARAQRDVARQEAQAHKDAFDDMVKRRDAAITERDRWERRTRDLENRIEQAQLALAGR